MTRPLDGGIKTTDRTTHGLREVDAKLEAVLYCKGKHSKPIPLKTLYSKQTGYCRGCKPQYIPEHARINRKPKRESVNE